MGTGPEVKAQGVRLADVFFVGPVMALAGLELQDRRPFLAVVLFGLAVSTVVYNARNYLEIQKRNAPPDRTIRGGAR